MNGQSKVLFGSPAALQNLPDFLALLAHDIRAPLSVFAGAADELTHPDAVPMTNDQRFLLGLMRRSESRLLRLAANLQCLSEGMVKPPIPTAFDLRVPVEQVVDSLQATQSKGPVWKLTLPSSPSWVHAGSAMVECALRNIFSNAQAFARTSVTISLTVCDGRILLEVVDDGSGFPQGFVGSGLEHLRSVTGERRPGVGLGLLIVNEVMKLHGGTLSLSNRAPERGARVSLELPEHAPAPADPSGIEWGAA